MSEINLELYVPNENGYFEHYKTIFFPFEFEDVGAPYLRSVSNHFFNSDDEYEFVYTTLSNTNSELGVLLFIFNESGEVLWSNESLNINMHFGECLIDNYFTTSARIVNVLDNSQQYKVINEFDCRNLPDGISGAFIVYPNPTNSEFRLALVDPDQFFERVEILDLEGRLIKSYQFSDMTSNDMHISTDDWAAGLFLIRIYSGNNIFIERLVKY
ncbi:MAG: T9SS type A sorting domain-containing protein [Cryomorphaceae bacterium]|nr:T9SS type A sorting domain-containing protein [Cryomorphaceae bacterium]